MSLCASRDQLERFLSDELDQRDHDTVLAHIEGCLACQQVLEQLIEPGRSIEHSSSIPTADERDAALIERLKTAGVGYPEPDAVAIAARLAAAEHLPAIQGFRIIREIGRGGMGVVYEAEDQQLGRHVALKVLSAHNWNQAKQVQRFDREARAAARLHHTHIVPIFGVGHQDGYHYLAMQYIEGVGLDRIIEDRRIGNDRSRSTALSATDDRTDRSVARVGLQVAEALHYAHRQGILHRDIKPSNLLLDATGNVWVADFGLAKTAEAEELTSTGDVLGTVRYLAPERFRGSCDARSDIHGLGLTLYELVTLRPAFEALDRYELIEQVRRAAPAPLRKLAPGVSRDLETIIQKAIAPEPERRYASAGALADDLRRFLEDRPIQARPVSLPGRLIRWCRRNPWAAAFLLALALGLVASCWQAVRATAAERAARRAELQVRNERDHAEVSRNRALASVRELLLMENGGEQSLMSDELRPYRKALIDSGLRASQELVRDLEGDPRAQLQLVEAYHAMGRIQVESGQRAAALESARKAVAVAEPLFNREHSVASGHVLAGALELLGTVLPDREARLSAFRRSRAVYEALLAEHPDDDRARWISSIISSHFNAGHCEIEFHRLREAIAEFQSAHAWGARLLAESAVKPQDRAILAYSELYFCRANTWAGQLDDARAAGQRSIAMYQALAQEQPANLEFSLQLFRAQQEVGFSYLVGTQTVGAIPDFEEAHRTLEGILARPGLLPSRIIEVQLLIAELDFNMRIATDGDPARYAALRRAGMSEAYEICDKVSLVRSLTRDDRQVFAHACFHMAEYREQDSGQVDLGLLQQSERLWTEMHCEDPQFPDARAYLVIVRQQLAEALEARGLTAEATRCRRDSMTPAGRDPERLYTIAVEYARYALDAESLARQHPLPGTEAQRRRFKHYAILNLREAIANGFKDAGRLRDETLLASIRPLPEFQALLGDLGFPDDVFGRQ
jgi:serine/threonine protein kinase